MNRNGPKTTNDKSNMITRNIHRLTTMAGLLAIAYVAMAQGENMETIADSHHLAAYAVAGLLIGVFTMIFSNRIFYYREKEVTGETQQVITQLGLVMDANKTEVWTMDPVKRLFTLYGNEGEQTKVLTPMEMAQRYDLEDFSRMRELILAIHQRRVESGEMTIRGRADDDGQRTYEVKISVLHYDKEGLPKTIIGIQTDTTDDHERREKARRLAMRYQTVFNSSLVDMIFYDKNGVLSDINDTACETFGIVNKEALLARKVRITDIPSYRNIDTDTLDIIRISSITDIDRTKQTDERIPEVKVGGKFYYEATVSSVRDEDGTFMGVIAAGRNITEMVREHHRQRANAQLLRKRNQEIQTYIDNINYTLRVSGVRLINYHPETHEMEISSDLNRAEYRLQQIRCISLIDPEDRRRARGLFLRMDRRREGAFMETIRTRFRDEEGKAVYLTFSVVPVTDKEGQISHYFGMARNDTEMHYTEVRLREETEKAQETEELKNTFLQNMSYEIRTPLNAVLGFAELFNAPHDEEDEPVFAEEIKRNTGDLLALVNDILFMSRLDAGMVEMNYQETDFAAMFDGYCYMGWSTLTPGVTVNVENPYSRLVIVIDGQQLGEVIHKLCAYAAHHTTEGYIRTKYEYRHGELSIAIEDTGAGYTKEALAHVFDRFAREEDNSRYGTGLDLPIIKELITQMGGSIEIQSEQGKGSTVYVIIPCEMREMEKRKEEGGIL